MKHILIILLAFIVLAFSSCASQRWQTSDRDIVFKPVKFKKK